MADRTPEQIIGRDALIQLAFEGFAVVPLEPEPAALDAGVAMALQVSVSGQGGWSKYIAGLYRQMILASSK